MIQIFKTKPGLQRMIQIFKTKPGLQRMIQIFKTKPGLQRMIQIFKTKPGLQRMIQIFKTKSGFQRMIQIFKTKPGLQSTVFNSFLAITRKFSVMIGTLLYVSGSYERHSKPTTEIYILLRPIAKRDILCCHLCQLGS